MSDERLDSYLAQHDGEPETAEDGEKEYRAWLEQREFGPVVTQRITKSCVCKACHGRLETTWGEGRNNYKIHCSECGGLEFVNKERLEEQKDTARREAQEVMRNYPELFGIERKSEKDNLKELGFGG